MILLLKNNSDKKQIQKKQKKNNFLYLAVVKKSSHMRSPSYLDTGGRTVAKLFLHNYVDWPGQRQDDANNASPLIAMVKSKENWLHSITDSFLCWSLVNFLGMDKALWW